MNRTASIAASLAPEQRKNLAIQVLAKNEPITDLAAREKVSRRFLYRQKSKATNALNQAFSPISSKQEVLFYLPVTGCAQKQLVIGRYSQAIASSEMEKGSSPPQKMAVLSKKSRI